MCYGLSVKETRLFAYRFAISYEKSIPETWRRNKSAGEEWMKLFRARHNISLRAPEATSLSQATSFNKHNVGLFFTNLRHVIERYGFNPNHIYNCDETPVTTVHGPTKIMAPCGQKQVEPDAENSTNDPDISDKDTAQPGCSRENTENNLSLHLTPKKNIVTPESIRPHLKAESRKLIQKRKVTSMILTDTPVIEENKQREAEKINSQ
ncbi:hypothetical protein JTB14_010003 [Gonioctena quinquepunctata]|nr:hypothetical protein JTB14_010003 [Gonioctena quinquepunctata]